MRTRLPLTSGAPVVSPTTGALLDFACDGARPGSLGKSVEQTTLGGRHAALKELENKLAWAVGTFYGVPYSGRRTEATLYVARIVRAVLRDHGYPINTK